MMQSGERVVSSFRPWLHLEPEIWANGLQEPWGSVAFCCSPLLPAAGAPHRTRVMGQLNSLLGKIMLVLGNGICVCPFLQCSKSHPS